MKGDKELTEIASNISSEALRLRTIELGNMIIADFMMTVAVNSPHLKLASTLQYHSSWDWLMPVWIKFKNLHMKGVSKHYHKQVCTSFANGILSGDIVNAWSDALMAINWYNHGKLP